MGTVVEMIAAAKKNITTITKNNSIIGEKPASCESEQVCKKRAEKQNSHIIFSVDLLQRWTSGIESWVLRYCANNRASNHPTESLSSAFYLPLQLLLLLLLLFLCYECILTIHTMLLFPWLS